jgi:hypothetical protein
MRSAYLTGLFGKDAQLAPKAKKTTGSKKTA